MLTARPGEARVACCRVAVDRLPQIVLRQLAAVLHVCSVLVPRRDRAGDGIAELRPGGLDLLLPGSGPLFGGLRLLCSLLILTHEGVVG